MAITQGQRDYEENVKKEPNYPDGKPRKKWSELSEDKKWSWERPYEKQKE